MPSPNWIHTLKRALGHYDEPYPGTPAYNHRRRLTESLSKIWRSHLHNLVLSDLQAGLHGRRKHFWEEMECIVAYELQPSTILGLLDEQRATGLLGLNTLDHLALHATYIFCPGFSGKNICSVRLVISIFVFVSTTYLGSPGLHANFRWSQRKLWLLSPVPRPYERAFHPCPL